MCEQQTQTHVDIKFLYIKDVGPFLQDLGVSDAGVGHVTVNATPPIPAWPCPCSTRNRLIVTNTLVAKWDVVHAALLERGITVNTDIE